MGIFGWIRRRRAPGAGSGGAGVIAEAQGEFSPAMMIAGRMRTVGVPYDLPRDTEEINRLDFQHYMLRYAFQGLYAAPIGQPASILDVGTGTGRWALEMARLFPRARVVGLDINPPPADQRADQGVDVRPPNYSFVAANVLEGLPFAADSFDFTHQRLLFAAIPADRWPFVVDELARVTRPGGWVELVEMSSVADGGPNIEMLADWLRRLTARRGVDVDAAEHVGDYLGAAPLKDVDIRVVNIPLGARGGRLGAMFAADFLSACRGFGGIAVQLGLTTQDEFDRTLDAARVDLNSSAYKCYAPFSIAVGQKTA